MRRILIPLAASVLLAASAVQPALAQTPAAPQAVGDVQLITVPQLWDNMYSTVRHADGSWQPWKVQYHTNVAGQLTSVVINGADHIFSVYTPQSPAIYWYLHTIRNADGTWTGGTVPEPSSEIADAQAVANLDGHIALVRKKGNVLTLFIEQSDGTWSAPETVPTSGAIGSFAVTANGGVLRVVSTSDGTRIGDYDRAADGTWSQPSWTPLNAASQVAVAQVGADLQVAAVANNDVWHAVRHADGTWDAFARVEGEAGTIDAVEQIAVTNSSGALHLVAVTANGGLYHTIRFADHTWQRFGDVASVLGPQPVAYLTLAGES